MASPEEVAWAAGLFDGEGSVTHSDRDLQLSLKNTDLELVERFYRIVDRGGMYGPYELRARDGWNRKPFWVWVAHGDAGHSVLDLFAPWLSARRRSQALEHGVILAPQNVETRKPCI